MRRKTYEVMVTKGTAFPTPTPFEILALDIGSATDWLARRGYVVHSIRPKPRGSRARWRLDQEALQQAIDFLGLEMPVYITKSPTSRTHGWHTLQFGWRLPQSAPAALRRQDLVHRINVSTTDSPEQASRTIWHELAHALQAEQATASESGAIAKNRAWCRTCDTEDEATMEEEACSYEQYAREIAPAVGA